MQQVGCTARKSANYDLTKRKITQPLRKIIINEINLLLIK